MEGETTESRDWGTIEWLVDHHATKLSERAKMVADLRFGEGEVILDLGCGPGLWTPLFADEVGSTGKVVGADRSEDFLRHGVRHFGGDRRKGVIQFTQADFHAVPFADRSFDAVFFGNCSAYVEQPVELLAEHKRVTKTGGRVIAKDFDGAILIFHPVDPVLSMEVLAATARSLSERPLDPPFDNFVGRKLHGVFLRAGFREVSTSTYAVQKLAPLSPEARRYIAGNAGWCGDVAAPFLSEHALEEWRRHFQQGCGQYILDCDDFYFCMLEVVTVGCV